MINDFSIFSIMYYETIYVNEFNMYTGFRTNIVH